MFGSLGFPEFHPPMQPLHNLGKDHRIRLGIRLEPRSFRFDTFYVFRIALVELLESRRVTHHTRTSIL